MRRRNWLYSLLLVLTACVSSGQTVCRPDAISGAERCEQTGGAADAAITGGSAAGLWAVKGCTINGCEPPFVCNSKSKQCERQRCSESGSCPPGYECSDGSCR